MTLTVTMEIENIHISFQSSGSTYASSMRFSFTFFDFIVYDESSLLPIFHYIGRNQFNGFHIIGKLVLNKEIKNGWKSSSLKNVEVIVGAWEAVGQVCLESS